MPTPADPTFFATPADFRAWLAEHHATRDELWVGFHKKGSGKPSITWPESVDEALCFGWIDGIRKSLGAESYVIRFTPRKPRSNWSAVNVARVAELTKEGRMRPAGLAAFEKRVPERTAIYEYEQPTRTEPAFDAASEGAFRENAAAWAFFQAQPPGYRKLFTRWVMSAKREETRARRLATLIDTSARERRVDPLDSKRDLAPPAKRPKRP
jgi:uncharacterized protein YdeI (YjbR/CyaY-like superfamily)